MNALEHNRYTGAWRELGASIPRPRGILVISAHWYVNLSAVTAMDRPKTIHDFYGFPDELFSVQYPAPGDPALAEEVAEIAKPTWVGLDHDSWGLDHGTWSVLVARLPERRHPRRPAVDQRAEAIRVPPRTRCSTRTAAPDGACSSSAAATSSTTCAASTGANPTAGSTGPTASMTRHVAHMTSSPQDLAALRGHSDFGAAVPTPDHFIPLLYLAGLASAAGSTAEVLVDGYTYGSLSMTSYTLDANWPEEQLLGRRRGCSSRSRSRPPRRHQRLIPMDAVGPAPRTGNVRRGWRVPGAGWAGGWWLVAADKNRDGECSQEKCVDGPGQKFPVDEDVDLLVVERRPTRRWAAADGSGSRRTTPDPRCTVSPIVTDQ